MDMTKTNRTAPLHQLPILTHPVSGKIISRKEVAKRLGCNPRAVTMDSVHDGFDGGLLNGIQEN